MHYKINIVHVYYVRGVGGEGFLLNYLAMSIRTACEFETFVYVM